MRTRFKLLLAVPFLVLCAGAGYLVANHFRGFSAEMALAVEPVRYRSMEAAIRSVSELRQFAKAVGKTETDEFRQLESQLLNNGAVVKFEAVQRIKKRDWRDAPDGMVERVLEPGNNERGMLGSLNGRFLDVIVSARMKEQAEALRLTQFAMDYFRHVMHNGVLRERLVQWGPLARFELALIAERAAKTASNVNELDQKIAAMRDLGERNKDLPQIPAVASTGVQLQVNSFRILSPQQQIVGFESERIDALAADREDQIKAAFFAILIRMSDEFLPKVDAGQSPESTVKQIAERVAALPTPSSMTERFAVERARAAVDVAVKDFESRWLGVRSDPEMPLSRPAGPSRALGLIVGFLVGLLVLIAFMAQAPIRRGLKRLVGDPL